MKRKAIAKDESWFLPQPDDVLFSSKGDPRWRPLSNFYVSPFEHDGHTYHHAEAAFQSAKARLAARMHADAGRSGLAAECLRIAEAIAQEPDPRKCKKLGGKTSLPMSPDALAAWANASERVMEDILRSKFAKAEVRACLAATGTARLFEARSAFADRVWGVYRNAKTGFMRGENKLGAILERIRDAFDN